MVTQSGTFTTRASGGGIRSFVIKEQKRHQEEGRDEMIVGHEMIVGLLSYLIQKTKNTQNIELAGYEFAECLKVASMLLAM